MAEVHVSLSLTLPIGGIDRGFIKPEVGLVIDDTGDVDAQLDSQLDVASRAFARLDDHMEVTISQLLATETGRPGYRDRVEALERTQQSISDRLNQVIRRLRDGGLKDLLAESAK